MILFSIQYTEAADEQIGGFQANQARIIRKKIDALATNPKPPGCKKMQGDWAPAWRITVLERIRIIYLIDEEPEKVVTVIHVGWRKNAYD